MLHHRLEAELRSMLEHRQSHSASGEWEGLGHPTPSLWQLSYAHLTPTLLSVKVEVVLSMWEGVAQVCRTENCSTIPGWFG